MTPEKTRRVAIAVGFLSGVLASMDAVRDAGILWPPDALMGSAAQPAAPRTGGRDRADHRELRDLAPAAASELESV